MEDVYDTTGEEALREDAPANVTGDGRVGLETVMISMV